MEFEHSEKVRALQTRVEAFMADEIYPNEEALFAQVNEGYRWQPVPLLEELKAKANAQGLWNLFLPESQYGAGLTNLEYAPLCEIMGRSPWAPEVFNCSAPDTGNMEVLVRYGTPEQRKRWLEPLLAGEIRSAFAMTSPRSPRRTPLTSRRASAATAATMSSRGANGGLRARSTRAARS